MTTRPAHLAQITCATCESTTAIPDSELAEYLEPVYSAAPELLEACNRLIQWIDAGCDPSDKSVAAARAAIARAEGGAA